MRAGEREKDERVKEKRKERLLLLNEYPCTIKNIILKKSIVYSDR